MFCSTLQDLSDDFTNLTRGGSLLIPNAQLNRYEPIQKLASDLNVADLKNIKLKNVNVGFNFQDGKIEIKPFTQSFNGIDMQCQGYNNFDKTIHYVLNFKIPREKFGKTLNAATSKLFAEAAKKGIKIEKVRKLYEG